MNSIGSSFLENLYYLAATSVVIGVYYLGKRLVSKLSSQTNILPPSPPQQQPRSPIQNAKPIEITPEIAKVVEASLKNQSEIQEKAKQLKELKNQQKEIANQYKNLEKEISEQKKLGNEFSTLISSTKKISTDPAYTKAVQMLQKPAQPKPQPIKDAKPKQVVLDKNNLVKQYQEQIDLVKYFAGVVKSDNWSQQKEPMKQNIIKDLEKNGITVYRDQIEILNRLNFEY